MDGSKKHVTFDGNDDEAAKNDTMPMIETEETAENGDDSTMVDDEEEDEEEETVCIHNLIDFRKTNFVVYLDER